MLPTATLRLRKGKERPLLQHHHWIYSGAIESVKAGDGELVEVVSFEGKKVGIGFYNPGHSISGHMIAFGKETVLEALDRRITKALKLRQKLFDPNQTNAVRLVNAEGDGIPGLIVDSYAGHLVIQISHGGLEKLRGPLVDLLVRKIAPLSITEKSTSFLRKKEGLEEVRGQLYGQTPTNVEILENGLRFPVDLLHGQKTGLFLDQREMRAFVRSQAQGKTVLNTFAYTGGFSVAALAGGASHVDSVESSHRCEKALLESLKANGLDADKQSFYTQDVFAFLKEKDLSLYDLIILDPPAFVKKRADIKNAFRAYKELNRIVIEKCRPATLLLTCSCSYHVSEELFQNILFRAGLESGRSIEIVGRHRIALDHPISLFHPESSYLKSFILFIHK